MDGLDHLGRARDLAAEGVAPDEGPPLRAREVRVPRLLDARQALAVHALESHHVGGELPVRIQAHALVDEAERGLVEAAHRLDRVGRQAALDEDEALGRVEALGDLPRRVAEDGREAPRERLAVLDPRGQRVERLRPGRHGEGLTVPVEDRARAWA